MSSSISSSLSLRTLTSFYNMFRKSLPTLLQDHFTEDQFEPIILKNTGEKKLRPFATPSIFLHRPVAKPRKPPPKRTRVESTGMFTVFIRTNDLECYSQRSSQI